MTTLITIQRSNSPDGTYNVNEPWPYPFHMDAATGTIERQEFWKGRPFSVIGFRENAEPGTVDLRWSDIIDDPQQIVGMFLVVLYVPKGEEAAIYGFECPIDRVTVTETEVK